MLLTPHCKFKEEFLPRHYEGIQARKLDSRKLVFIAGDPSDSLFYIRHGFIRLSVTTSTGKSGVISVLGPGEFFGELCRKSNAGSHRTAQTITPCEFLEIPKDTMLRLLHERWDTTEQFLCYVMCRITRHEDDLADQLFNPSEKRLARVLLLLKRSTSERSAAGSTLKITQELLAEMVGTTRPRISYFMNRFRKKGFVACNGNWIVNDSLLAVLTEPAKSAQRRRKKR